jgi:hypothetical protein
MPNQPREFDLYQMAKDQGKVFDSIGPTGNPIFVDDKGNKKEFDVQGFAKEALGVDPKEVTFTINNPDTAIPTSPLTPGERAMWATGDAKTYKDAMSKRFQDTAYDPEKGLMVKDQGVWKQLDPSFFEGGDPWKITENLTKAASAVQRASSLGAGSMQSLQTYGKGGSVSDSVNAAGREFAGDVKEAATGYKDALVAGYNFLTKGLPSAAKNYGLATAYEYGLSNSPEAQSAEGSLASQGMKSIPSVLEGAGQMVGQAEAGKPGAVLLGAGGRMGGNKIVHSLGRYMGTYNEDPGTEVAQNFFEGLMSAIGTSVGLGVKPTAAALDSTIATASKEMAPPVKSTMEKVLTGAGIRPDSAKFIVQQGEDFVGKKKQIWGQAGKGAGFEEVTRVVNNLNHDLANDLVESARPSLTKLQGNQFETFYKAAGERGAQVDKAVTSGQLVKVLEESGYGKLEWKGQMVPKTEQELLETFYQKNPAARAYGLNPTNSSVAASGAAEGGGQLGDLIDPITGRRSPRMDVTNSGLNQGETKALKTVGGQRWSDVLTPDEMIKPTGKGAWKFNEFTPEERTLRQQQNMPATTLLPQERKAIGFYMKQINADAGGGVLKGEAAGRYMAELNKSIGRIHNASIPAGQVAPSSEVNALISKLSGRMRDVVGQHMDQAGLTKEWSTIRQVQEKYINAVNWAEQAAAKDGGPMGVVKAIVDPKGQRPDVVGANGHLAVLADLLGEEGSGKIKDIIGNQAVADSTKLFKTSIGAAAGRAGALGALAFGSPVVAGAVAVPLVASASPRAMTGLALAQQTSRKWLTLVKQLPQEQLYKSMTDSTLAPMLMRPLVTTELEQLMADKHVENALKIGSSNAQ